MIRVAPMCHAESIAMSNPSHEDDEPMPRRHPEPHAPFPVTPLLILTLGALLFLLVISLGFNAWLFFNPDVHFDRGNEMRRAMEIERQLRMQAEDAQQRAAILQQESQRKEAALRRDIDDLNRQLEEWKRAKEMK
jgi:hypothetical protein